MAQTELTVLVFECLDVDFHLVTFLEVGIVAELADGYDGVGLHADINTHFALADRFHGAGHHFVFFRCLERLVVGVHQLLTALVGNACATFVALPIEVLDRGLNF